MTKEKPQTVLDFPCTATLVTSVEQYNQDVKEWKQKTFKIFGYAWEGNSLILPQKGGREKYIRLYCGELTAFYYLLAEGRSKFIRHDKRITKGQREVFAQCYALALKERLVHPHGNFDNAGRWYPHEEYERRNCCERIGSPSRRFKYSYMNTHCRSALHVATLLGVDVKIVKQTPGRVKQTPHKAIKKAVKDFIATTEEELF